MACPLPRGCSGWLHPGVKLAAPVSLSGSPFHTILSFPVPGTPFSCLFRPGGGKGFWLQVASGSCTLPCGAPTARLPLCQETSRLLSEKPRLFSEDSCRIISLECATVSCQDLTDTEGAMGIL